MLVLVIGDVMGRPGREAVTRVLPSLRQELDIHLVIANGENSAGGRGVTASTANELFESGSESKLKEAGKVMLKGKDYIVEDGDIMHVRFNV